VPLNKRTIFAYHDTWPNQANFETTTRVTSAVDPMLFSITRGKAFACTIAPSQPRQPYLGRFMRKHTQGRRNDVQLPVSTSTSFMHGRPP
jgi:hypothetical protein